MPTVPKQSISKKPDGYRWQLPRKSVFRPDPTSCQPTNIFQKIQALFAKFLQAVDESTQYINDHLDESAEYLADKLGLKAEDFKENWKNYSFEPGFSEEATTHLEDIEKWGFEHGSFPKDYNVRDFINTDVAKIAFPDNVTIE